MNATQLADGSQMTKETLLVCDAAGMVQAASSGSADQIMSEANLTGRHFAEIFGQASQITVWFAEQINESAKHENYSAHSRIETGSAPVEARLDSLNREGELYGYALTVREVSASSTSPDLEEGDAVIFRSQWHEIKNQVGALKLYATYLIRKMPESDDRNTVEKMLNGINGLIDYLAKIRRGEAQ